MSIATPTSQSTDRVQLMDALAGLLHYPGENYLEEATRAGELLSSFCPAASGKMGEFLEFIRAMDPEELEERHLSAFELDPSGVLYTGIHLFGEESFKRGAFMAELNSRYREAGVELGDEIPDHVSVVLGYYGRASEEEREELARYVLLGTLEKMASHTGSSTVYQPLLGVMLQVIATEFPGMKAAPFPISMEPSSCAVSGSTSDGCGSGCNMKGPGMGDRDFLTSEDES